MRDALATGVTLGSGLLMGLSPVEAYQKYSELQAQISEVDSMIIGLSGRYPLLMSGLETNSPIEEQTPSKRSILHKFASMDPENIKEKKFNQVFKKAKKQAQKKFKQGLDRMCDSRNGITNDQIILLPEFTGQRLKNFLSTKSPSFASNLGLGGRIKQMVDDLAVPGAALGCLFAAWASSRYRWRCLRRNVCRTRLLRLQARAKSTYAPSRLQAACKAV